MKLIYDVNDRPKFGQLLVFSLQQLLAIMAATIAVPNIIGNGLTPSAALFGAGVGTIVYLLLPNLKAPCSSVLPLPLSDPWVLPLQAAFPWLSATSD